jgi:hypothetical protein
MAGTEQIHLPKAMRTKRAQAGLPHIIAPELNVCEALANLIAAGKAWSSLPTFDTITRSAREAFVSPTLALAEANKKLATALQTELNYHEDQGLQQHLMEAERRVLSAERAYQERRAEAATDGDRGSEYAKVLREIALLLHQPSSMTTFLQLQQYANLQRQIEDDIPGIVSRATAEIEAAQDCVLASDNLVRTLALEIQRRRKPPVLAKSSLEHLRVVLASLSKTEWGSLGGAGDKRLLKANNVVRFVQSMVFAGTEQMPTIGHRDQQSHQFIDSVGHRWGRKQRDAPTTTQTMMQEAFPQGDRAGPVYEWARGVREYLRVTSERELTVPTPRSLDSLAYTTCMDLIKEHTMGFCDIRRFGA